LTGSDIETPRVVEGYDDVAPHVADIVEASDANRDSLGFFPRSLFDDFARRGGLLALLISDGSGSDFAGYLLFQRQFPRASILQL
jgi:hypothetical protein